MRDTILLQHGSNGHERMLEITDAAHRKYCQKHNIDFISTQGNFKLDGHHAMWHKVYLMQKAARNGYSNIIWLDADCLIVDFETDLREAITEGKIGCTWHSLEWGDLAPVCYDHWCTGAIYLHATAETKGFLNLWWETPDEDHPWHDQHAFNRTLQQPMYRGVDAFTHEAITRTAREVVMQSIDPKWNSIYPLFESQSPVVRAWHGWKQLPEREKCMAEAVEVLTWI